MHLVVPRTCLILHQSNHNSNFMMTYASGISKFPEVGNGDICQKHALERCHSVMVPNWTIMVFFG